MTVKTAPVRKRQNDRTQVWGPMVLVHIYRFAKMGFCDRAIAEGLGIDSSTLKKWKRTKPEVVEALALARNPDEEDRELGGTWKRFVYNRLSPDLRKLWDQIEKWDTLPNGVAKIEALLSTHGKRVRQQLFLYALIHCNFSASKALAKVNIDRATLSEWIEKEPEFGQLVEEIKWHKGNFFEESLVRLVSNGEAAATIFANRTYNKDRGYGGSTDVNVRHSGTIEHTTLDLDELELPIETRKQIMEAIRLRDFKLQQEKARAMLPESARALLDLQDDIAEGVSNG